MPQQGQYTLADLVQAPAQTGKYSASDLASSSAGSFFTPNASPEVIAQQRAGLEASGAIPKAAVRTNDTAPGLPRPGSQPIPKPIEYALRATPLLSGVDSIPSLVTALRVAGGSVLGGMVGKAGVEAAGGGETAQKVGEIGGGLLGGGVAGTGLTRALLQTPVKELAAKNSGALLNILEPRKAVISYIKSVLADDSVNSVTHPATESALKSVSDVLESGGTKSLIDSIPKTPFETYLESARKVLPDTATAATVKTKATALQQDDSAIVSTLDDVIKRMHAEAPPPTSELYGKTPTKSNLLANIRQLASKTGSTAPVPETPAPSFFSLGSMKNYAVKGGSK